MANPLPGHWKTSVLLPFYQKDIKTECKSYHGISLIDVAVIIYSIVLLNHFKGQGRKELKKIKLHFGKVEAVRFIIQQFKRLNHRLMFMFLDLIAFFASVTRLKLRKIMENNGMPMKFIGLMECTLSLQSAEL